MIGRPDDFYDDAHRKLFVHMTALHETGKKIGELLVEIAKDVRVRVARADYHRYCGPNADPVRRLRNAGPLAQRIREQANLRMLQRPLERHRFAPAGGRLVQVRCEKSSRAAHDTGEQLGNFLQWMRGAKDVIPAGDYRQLDELIPALRCGIQPLRIGHGDGLIARPVHD
jgi:hypothetical protein